MGFCVWGVHRVVSLGLGGGWKGFSIEIDFLFFAFSFSFLGRDERSLGGCESICFENATSVNIGSVWWLGRQFLSKFLTEIDGDFCDHPVIARYWFFTNWPSKVMAKSFFFILWQILGHFHNSKPTLRFLFIIQWNFFEFFGNQCIFCDFSPF